MNGQQHDTSLKALMCRLHDTKLSNNHMLIYVSFVYLQDTAISTNVVGTAQAPG